MSDLCKIHDCRVHLKAGTLEYIDTAENYALDAGESFPALPSGNIGRTYIPGERHFVTTGRKSVQLQPPWEEGDALLLRVAEFIAAKASREKSLQPPPATKNELIAGFESNKVSAALLAVLADQAGITLPAMRTLLKKKLS